MLIKLTSKCTMMCPHCMDDAMPKGDMMSMDTFKKTVDFGFYIGTDVFVLSGGEPTENNNILEMCKYLNRLKFAFSIVSNGMWLKDEAKTKMVEEITHLENFVGMQVYTNKKWYKEYDYVISHKDEYEKYRNILVDTCDIRGMQDLGRARNNKKAQKEVMENQHFMSCLNSCLAARQCSGHNKYGTLLLMSRQLCKPSVDALGNVHMSESRLCPSVGNVCEDDFKDIWLNMKGFLPCGKCHQYKTFVESKRMDVIRARMVLGID